ncbi:cell wall serine-threonine-rich galactomannoprotein Mp1 [Beauveria brongniartii RCEF 3172]|uniref:Cell wall serine-threonine-rich galactomannoprotein Mp1 n=1 Tax=Beauveria brongniartii RCEF 3172 TaxID=1081107 RepID=A0A167JF39_9HYPO|nr:cell wall serine-threonine-rich galactomannoprotein Mp1 [Beauveria brongniartii RCEF 3172]
MKFAVAFTLASTALAGVTPRDATVVKGVISTVNSDIKSVKSAVDAYNGDKSDLVKAADQLVSDLKAGKTKVESGPDLTTSDAVELGSGVQDLAKTGSGLTEALESKKPQVEKAGECKTVQDQIAAISTNSKSLIDAVVAKVPEAAKSIAEELSGQLITVLEQAEESYKDCQNSGNSGSSSSTGAGSSGTATATGTGSATQTGSATKTGTGSATATHTKPGSVTTSCASSATGTGGVTPTSSQVTIPTGAAAIYAPAGVFAAVAAILAL